ncbi:hypothetical protein TIFTF001_019301 [Ficus carica]|uniref:Uncharacterized protein n=1 Tax=Ficus carica TaxID=3494 RepID=A0AA88ABE2_FICCA|nr:hypothetical protein TIFTF001_019301 [Ficus carica]
MLGAYRLQAPAPKRERKIGQIPTSSAGGVGLVKSPSYAPFKVIHYVVTRYGNEIVLAAATFRPNEFLPAHWGMSGCKVGRKFDSQMWFSELGFWVGCGYCGSHHQVVDCMGFSLC